MTSRWEHRRNLDALGTYDFTNLTVFNWTVDDGPFNPLGIVFEQMTIEQVIFDEDGDGVPDDQDLCPETDIPEGVPMLHLGVNRWALMDEDGIFDTQSPPGQGQGNDFSFDIHMTAGCSCEQIIEERGLGEGHVKFGCSSGVMLGWVRDVGDIGDYGPPIGLQFGDVEGGVWDLDSVGSTRFHDDPAPSSADRLDSPAGSAIRRRTREGGR